MISSSAPPENHALHGGGGAEGNACLAQHPIYTEFMFLQFQDKAVV